MKAGNYSLLTLGLHLEPIPELYTEPMINKKHPKSGFLHHEAIFH